MAVITISRQYGSGGDEIAAKVCELLKYCYFDKQMMSRLAAELALPAGQSVDFSEEDYRVRTFMERFFRAPCSQPVAQVKSWKETPDGTRVAEVVDLDEANAMFLERSAILAAHRQGNMVIVGRGGQVVLKEKHGTLHVRIEAPLDFRVEHVKEQENLSLAAARDLVMQRDQSAANYLKHFYKVDWSDPLLYHLVINTCRFELDAAACLIACSVNCLSLALCGTC